MVPPARDHLPYSRRKRPVLNPVALEGHRP